jgi:hypothetical protein
MPRCLAITYAMVVVVAAAGLGGCGHGGGGPSGAASTATTSAGPLPALASRPPAKGEIVVRGESSPATHGPYTFAGRYLVRFEQYAPEDPRLDFRNQTAFVANLERQAGVPAVRLFRTARASGRRTVTAHGRFLVDVSFGDFPYVLRLTPVRE